MYSSAKVRRIFPALLVAAIALASCGGGGGGDDEPAAKPAAKTTTTKPAADGATGGVPKDNKTPSFVGISDVKVTVEGATTKLSVSPLRNFEFPVFAFSDRATAEFEGIHSNIRRFLNCSSDTWTLGPQSVAVDHLADALSRQIPSLIERAFTSIDFAVAIPVAENGVHQLARDCDAAIKSGAGGGPGSTRWFAELGRAVHLLKAQNKPEYADRIATYQARIELLASKEKVERQTDTDAGGNVFTNRLFIRAAGLQLAASLTDSDVLAADWSAKAEQVARRAIEGQADDGTFPERAGFDVRLQMQSVWYAELYESVLPRAGEMRGLVEAAIDTGIDRMLEQVDPTTGVVDVSGSTRTCTEIDKNRRYDPARAVEALIYRSITNSDRKGLVDTAVLIDRAIPRRGNPAYNVPDLPPCPTSAGA